jgi:hypothetical protein
MVNAQFQLFTCKYLKGSLTARTSSMNGKSLDRSSRQSRASALVSFVDEHSLDEIQNGQYEDKEDEG